MEERKFAATKTKIGGRFHRYGIVICADGTLNNPDYRISTVTNNLASESEWLEVWNEVPEDAAALRWEWHHGRHHFTVAFRPEVVTQRMLNTAKRLYQDIVSERAADIDWTDMCLWRHNPTGAPGWNLEVKPIPSDEELCARVEAANKRLEAFAGSASYERPRATLHHLETGWHILIDDDFGQCSLAPLINASVESFLQQERDYICHTLAIQNRRQLHEFFAPRYELFRSDIESHEGQLLDMGADGFCVIVGDEAKIYGLSDNELTLFARYCESLKQA